VKVTVYEVGPRDGLQYLPHIVDTKNKRLLIKALYDAGVENIEEVSFAHPKIIPQMADAEKVFTGKGAGLVMNKRGFDRAMATGVEKVNIVLSPCETFNMRSFRMTRSELVFHYHSFLNKYPKEKVRVYISMAFGSPYSGLFDEDILKSCIIDAKLFGNTVVFSDTVGIGDKNQIKQMARLALKESLIPALHLHHKGDESRPLTLVRAGLLAGIKQFDASIGGLGGCPMVEGSGSNLSTETLVRHLNAWGFESGIDENRLDDALKIVRKIKQEPMLAIPTLSASNLPKQFQVKYPITSQVIL
jgi:hydroxymethylglutaryl-CoA lyase|tara:strand:- start:3086 stop:3991 length:906 start_codon:yes stop_codon:yes gene_type:complete